MRPSSSIHCGPNFIYLLSKLIRFCAERCYCANELHELCLIVADEKWKNRVVPTIAERPYKLIAERNATVGNSLKRSNAGQMPIFLEVRPVWERQRRERRLDVSDQIDCLPEVQITKLGWNLGNKVAGHAQAGQRGSVIYERSQPLLGLFDLAVLLFGHLTISSSALLKLLALGFCLCSLRRRTMLLHSEYCRGNADYPGSCSRKPVSGVFLGRESSRQRLQKAHVPRAYDCTAEYADASGSQSISLVVLHQVRSMGSTANLTLDEVAA